MSQSATSGTRQDRRRQYQWYALGLAVVYVVGAVALRPDPGQQPGQAFFLVLMFAPTAGALLARWRAGGRIRWGRPGAWLLAGLAPAAAALVAYLVGAAVGWDVEDPGVLARALALAPLSILTASLSAVGEEIGWRGFLWPTLRRDVGFWTASAVVGVVWWLYHLPMVLLGWYGTIAGLPAFTVAIAGFTLFVGVVTDRSRSLWPSVVAHGAWNGLVATSFAATDGTDSVPAFSGSEALLGEFGWLAAVSTIVLGVGAAAWHTRD